MAVNEVRPWLVTYDIRDRRRLARVHRYMSEHAVPVQYSVFALTGTIGFVRRLVGELRGLLDLQRDDVRVYPIPKDTCIDFVGKPMLPEGVWLLSKFALDPSTAHLLGNSRDRATPAVAIVSDCRVPSHGKVRQPPS